MSARLLGLAALALTTAWAACGGTAEPAAFEETKVADLPEVPDDVALEVSSDVDDADTSAAPTDARRETSWGPLPDVDDAGPGEVSVGPDPEPVEPDALACDAGDAAWAARAIVAVWGRRPLGTAEIAVWARLAEEAGRAEALEAMMRSPEYVERWFDFLLDALRVSRVGDKRHDVCFGGPIRADDAGQLAAHVRDSAAVATGTFGAFNMTDLLRSALRLDDMSPVYRAHLFAMLAKPLTGANVDEVEMDLARRRDFGEVFEAAYLARNTTCTTCHNSTFSVTGDADPALDRTWEIPGHFETALFEYPSGRPAEDVHALLRHLGVATDAISGARPWGWSSTCGRIRKPGSVKEDPVAAQAFFIEPHGTLGSVWALEAALEAGFAGLRADGLDRDAVTLEVSGPEAFAYLVSVNLANQVWSEVYGHPLTIANYFPRNRGQRDTLWQMTERFVARGFSLRELVRYAVLDPRFNQLEPESGCGGSDGYYLRPTFDPWTVHEDDPTLQGNGAGDLLVRLPARTLLRTMVSALGWPTPSRWPDATAEALHVAIGAFTKDAEPGFRGVDFQGLLAWEDTHGVCSAVVVGGPTGPGCEADLAQGCGGCTCEACVCELDDFCCDKGWDAFCVKACNEDCGGCDAGPPPALPDYVSRLLEALAASPGATVGDAAKALKDRLVQEPFVTSAEAPLLEALLDVPLTTPAAGVADLDGRLRRLCGLLAQTPQLMLSAAPDPQALAAGPSVFALPGESVADHCERVRALWDPAVAHLSCAEGDVVLSPPIPAKPDPTPRPEAP